MREKVKGMKKEKIKQILDMVARHSKIIFPVLVVLIVAATVVFSLRANGEKANRTDEESLHGSLESNLAEVGGDVLASVENLILPATASPEPTAEPVSDEVPLVANDNAEVYSAVATYYNSMALGDESTLLALYDEISETDLLRYVETAQYLDYYTALDVYSKPGLNEGDTIAYVYYKVRFVNCEEEFPGYQALYICTNDEGKLYIKNEANFTEKEIEYIKKVSSQADVTDFSNRVSVEYSDLLVANPVLLEFLNKLGEDINTAISNALAEKNGTKVEEPVATEIPATPAPEVPVDQYARATTTVNVRSSDSEQADSMGKISTGTRIKVLEIGVNGWSKVLYEGKEGFIKSEYLQMEEDINSLEVIGKVTATDNVVIRSFGSTEGTRLGVLTKGESLELLGIENGWCKVKYEDQIAYVSENYVKKE